MNRNRKSIVITAIISGAIIAFVIYQFVQVKRIFGVKDQRIVQILESPDGQFKADLTRRYEFLDLNFIIRVDGEQIFRSPDFTTSYRIPFRETLLWDKTGKNLIFEVGGHRLFGYSATEKRQLSDKQLLSLEVQNPKPEDFRYSGHWPSLETQSAVR